MEQSRKTSASLRSAGQAAAPVVRAVPDVSSPEAPRRPPVTIRKISRSVDALGVRVKALERSMGELSTSLERHLDELHRTMGLISRRITQLAAQRPPAPPEAPPSASSQATGFPSAGDAPRDKPSPEKVEELRRRVWDES